ncbi:hypothetical protein [Capsulimonas corticalis]|uniref:hypothetical protein n=1 Tax=Capsulimonas corticalis TaxID=2219043 RepID=UPI000F649039|nr:hypothetical protein [Capsulimonas corticalis]
MLLIAGRAFKIVVITIPLVLLAVFALWLTPYGGRLLWDISNQPFLRSDVSTLFRGQGVIPQDLDCHMVGTTRSGYCTFHVSPKDADKAVRKFNLTRLPSYQKLGIFTEYELHIPGVFVPRELALPKLDEHFAKVFHDDYPQIEQDYVAGADVQCFVTSTSSNMAALVPSANSPHFHSLYIFYRPSTGEMSAEVQYPYG